MNNIGFKIYKNQLDNDIIIQKALLQLENKGFLELGTYRTNPFTFEDIEKLKLFHFNSEKIIYHSDYNYFDLNTYLSKEDDYYYERLIEEIEQAIHLNAKKMVLHLEKDISKRITSEEDILYYIKETVSLFKLIYEEFPASKVITIFIENTFSSLDFYKKLILTLKINNFNVGFTLDIGHCKVWSSNSLSEWIDMAKMFYNKDIPLHFHIHSNEGENDTHTPLHIGINNEFFNIRKDRPDLFYSNDLIKDISEIVVYFKESSIILEVPIFEAEKDKEIILKYIQNNE